MMSLSVDFQSVIEEERHDGSEKRESLTMAAGDCENGRNVYMVTPRE